MQQPKAQMQPKVVGEWTTPLWGCFSDWGNCITTLFCPCITYGQIANIVDQGKTSCFSGGKTYAILMNLTCGCCLYSCFSRTKLRFMYNLPPSPCGCADCVVHTCCEPCALCQEYRELQNRGYNMAIGWDLNRSQVGSTTVDAPISQMMNQMDIMNNGPEDRQNVRNNNQNTNRQNDDAPISDMMDEMNIMNNRPDDRQNVRYNNQNTNRPNNAPMGQMMDQMGMTNNHPNDRQNYRYNNQNNRQNDGYNIQNNRQNDRYDNQNDRQNDQYDNQNNRQNEHYDTQNEHQNEHQEQEY